MSPFNLNGISLGLGESLLTAQPLAMGPLSSGILDKVLSQPVDQYQSPQRTSVVPGQAHATPEKPKKKGFFSKLFSGIKKIAKPFVSTLKKIAGPAMKILPVILNPANLANPAFWASTILPAVKSIFQPSLNVDRTSQES